MRHVARWLTCLLVAGSVFVASSMLVSCADSGSQELAYVTKRHRASFCTASRSAPPAGWHGRCAGWTATPYSLIVPMWARIAGRSSLMRRGWNRTARDSRPAAGQLL